MFDRPNPELDMALELSKSDPQQAANALRIAASYLKAQQPLPPALASFLGDAFERAMKKIPMYRGSELLVNLNLEVKNRRTKANFEHVGIEVEQLVQAKVPKGEAIIRAGETYKLSESSVKRMHKQYLALKAAEALDDGALYEAEQRNYAQQSAIKNEQKIGVQRKGSKGHPSSDLDFK
jgi:hypothetical protein